MTAPTVITFVDEAYIPVGKNWLSAITSLCTGASIRIVALDAATRDAFPPEMVMYRPVRTSSRADLWILRIRVIHDLLQAGETVVHSDADAIWLRDPLPTLEACGSDMVFSQGTIWPPDVHARHGLVLCCGFFQLSPTPAVLRFMDALEARVAKDGDDQISLNRLLDENGLQWRIEEPYQLPFRDTSFTASRSVIRSSAGSVPSVAVLPHHIVPRLPQPVTGDVLVAHPLSPKTLNDKMTALTKLGLWHPDGWTPQRGR